MLNRNRVRAFRTEKKLTQRQLAEAVSTSQQQIQRIESGVQAARLVLAVKIAEALGQPLQKVFPGAVQARGKRGQASEPPMSPGIDPELAVWTLSYRLRGGAEGALPVAGPHVEYLRRALYNSSKHSDGWPVFDSGPYRVALNLSHLIHCQLLFEPDYEALAASSGARPSERDGAEDRMTRVILCDKPEPVVFEVSEDDTEVDDEDIGDNASTMMQLEIGAFEENERICLTDDDGGEEMFFRVGDIALLMMPISACDAELRKAEWEGFKEENDHG